MAIKVGMVSLGCSKNQVDAEIMLSKINSAGYELCTDSGLCDVVIVNTCGFIESAKTEAIENILEFVTLKNEGRIKAIIVTGCLSERYREEVAKELPEVDAVVGIGSNADIVDIIGRVLNGERVVTFGNKEDLPLDGQRIISNLPFFAYLKIAEGCDNRCTYCAIPMIRGNFRSRTIENIVAEAKTLARNGVKELIVIAQDITRYGLDLYGERRLPALLDALCAIDGIEWIRLLYTYPDEISDELIDCIASQPKIVKYLDIPLQHISDNVLRAMNRRGSSAEIRAMIQKLRQRIPGIVLRTTFIVGFPGETEEDFEELCEFVRDTRFERLGCFAYSAEEDTPAAAFENQIDEEVKQRRCEVLMDEQLTCAENFCESMVGQTLDVIVEGYDRYASSCFGRSVYDSPDIDPKVFFTTPEAITAGDIVKVKITDWMDYDLIGETEV
ncbi:MAG: 30S ribosomal protein S12 methylthiotransferase RimO [Ruminococcaceae bacterium]|nr:30S ribosomal protein S12 methylthiotransferase RimO [Oscillospiraceae bacterium]